MADCQIQRRMSLNRYADDINMWCEHPDSQLFIGKGVGFGKYVTIICKERIEIDDGCAIASGVSIVDCDHYIGLPHERIGDDGETAKVHIGEYSWIGANAVILKGVTLGKHCIVGAGAVVTKSFPDDSIIVGNPARLLRKRPCPKSP